MRPNYVFRYMLAISIVACGLCATAAWSQDRSGAPWQATRRYLFVQNAQTFTIESGRLVLAHPWPTTTYVADRPDRVFGVIRTIDFVELWSHGGNSMAETAPDATLQAIGSLGKPAKMRLAISNPRAEGTSLVYDVEFISGDQMTAGKACALFIDPSAASARARKKASEPAPAAHPEPINARDRSARAVLASYVRKDAGMQTFADNSAGYAIFPSVAKGALIVGGARGDGVVYDKNHNVIGYSTLTQGTVGLQVGGQEYSEIIFFEDDAALSHFKRGNAEFSAQASAVAVDAGASADADYADGVAIFTMAKGGLMLEASVGGQGFSFDPLK